MKKIILIAFGILLIIGLGTCFLRDRSLSILTENYPPLSFIQDGEITGFGTDVVHAIQQELGTDHQIHLLSWDAAYSTALRDANIVLYTIDRTPEREELFYFVGPLGSNVASLYSLSADPLRIETLEDAKEVDTIATTTNWFTEQYLVEQRFSNLLSMVDPLHTLKLLKEGKADLAVFTDVTLPDLCREAGVDMDSLTPVYELLSSDYYIAISKKTDVKVKDAWQDAFEKIKENGSLDELKTKWFNH